MSDVRATEPVIVHRVLPPEPVATLDDYVAAGGGRGIEAARAAEADVVIAEIEASGLRGRGGAGFPTGTKWRTVRDNRGAFAASVVVNGAEGEPGTFKDRAILRANPYQVIEGALIAAHVIGAARLIIALKRSFAPEVARLSMAVDEARAAGWFGDVTVSIFEGPDEYLYGEETALLETLDGRLPFPRIAPPYRRGVDEVVETAADVGTESGDSAHVEMAGASGDLAAAPTLVDNVETLANVPSIVAEGATWFRAVGTADSPGTIVCTVTGSVARAGVGEVAMGTSLQTVIDAVGGGAAADRTIVAVLPGVSNGFVSAANFSVPVSYEGFASIGSGLGSASFMVLDDSDDLTAFTAGASRFLAVESCGQCEPCKQDGLVLADLLAKVARAEAEEADLDTIRAKVETVAYGARCSLATQHETIVRSLLEHYAPDVDAHVRGETAATEPTLVADLLAIEGESAVIDERRRDKQPDWTYDDEWSGSSPAELHADHLSPPDPE